MRHLCLLSGKSFTWDGTRFHHPGNDVPPMVFEVEELSYLLLRDFSVDHAALAKYLREYFGTDDAKFIRRPLHAIDWIDILQGGNCNCGTKRTQYWG